MREEGTLEDLGWDNEGDDELHQELCNCRFSLAYGGKILLNNASLRLVGGVGGKGAVRRRKERPAVCSVGCMPWGRR